MTPGIYSIPFEQYVAIPAASKHLLDALAISPLHAWAWFLNPERRPQKETPAKVLGSAVHTAILEPERFEQEYIQEPEINSYPNCLSTLDDLKDRCKELKLPVSGTKAILTERLLAAGEPLSNIWDHQYSQLTQGKKTLSVPDWRVVKAITARVRKHPAASELLKYGKSEQSIFWTDPDTGVSCKGRLDWLHTEGIIVDLKSTTDASPTGFQRSVAKYRYYVQSAMYKDGLIALGKDPHEFVFAAWEKSSPYASALYYADGAMLEAGRTEYKRLLKVYRQCLETDTWKGYSDAIEAISLPLNFQPSSLSELETESDWLSEMEHG